MLESTSPELCWLQGVIVWFCSRLDRSSDAWSPVFTVRRSLFVSFALASPSFTIIFTGKPETPVCVHRAPPNSLLREKSAISPFTCFSPIFSVWNNLQISCYLGRSLFSVWLEFHLSGISCIWKYSRSPKRPVSASPPTKEIQSVSPFSGTLSFKQAPDHLEGQGKRALMPE